MGGGVANHPFQQMLWQGETVKKVLRPHKKKFVLSRMANALGVMFAFLVFFGIGSIMILTTGEIGELWFIPVIFLVIWLGIALLSILWNWIAGNLWYKNRWYCYTTHRIIVQCGILSRNYRFFQLNQLQSSFVRVGLIDRIVNKNTGSIMFSRHLQSRFITSKGGMGQGLSSEVYFLHVENPCEVLREVEESARAVGGMTGGMGVMMMGNPMMGGMPMMGQPMMHPQQPPGQPAPQFDPRTGQPLPPQQPGQPTFCPHTGRRLS